MVSSIWINKIVNGYVVNSGWDNGKKVETYHPDMLAVIGHLDGVWGGLERELKKIREEKKNEESTKSLRAEDREAAEES